MDEVDSVLLDRQFFLKIPGLTKLIWYVYSKC